MAVENIKTNLLGLARIRAWNISRDPTMPVDVDESSLDVGTRIKDSDLNDYSFRTGSDSLTADLQVCLNAFSTDAQTL